MGISHNSPAISRSSPAHFLVPSLSGAKYLGYCPNLRFSDGRFFAVFEGAEGFAFPPRRVLARAMPAAPWRSLTGATRIGLGPDSLAPNSVRCQRWCKESRRTLVGSVASGF